MVVILLNIILQFAIFSLFLKIVGKTQIKKIKESASVDEAIRQKKILIKKRKTCLYIFIALLIVVQASIICVGYYYSNLLPANSECRENIYSRIIIPTYFGLPFYIILLCVYLDYSNKNNKYIGNLSTRKASDLLMSDENFVLYLRGFESDIYKNKKTDEQDFSEDVLSKVVLKGLGLPLCAVGMTKEIECPLGGIRVYVNDENWEEEVIKLMNKAEKIIYLVNDRKSCIWEIKNSTDVYHKCVFVVDDLKKYNNVQTQLKGTVDLPRIPASEFEDLPLESDPRRFYFTSDNIMNPFNGETSDYCQMISLDANAVSKSDIKNIKNKPLYTKPWFIVVMIIVGIRAILGSIATILEITDCIKK